MVDTADLLIPGLLLVFFLVVLWWAIVAWKGRKYVNTATQTRGITNMTNNGDGTYSVKFSCPSGFSIKVNPTYVFCPQCDPFEQDGSVNSNLVVDVTSQLAPQVNGKSGQLSAIVTDIPSQPPGCSPSSACTWMINGTYDLTA